MLNKKLKTLLAIGLVSSAAAFGPIASAQAPRENPQSAASHHGIRYVKAEAVNVRGGPGVSRPRAKTRKAPPAIMASAM